MLKKDVKIGSVYAVKVSGKVVPVKIISVSSYGGWVGKNLNTGREIRIKTAGKLRGEIVKKDENKTHINFPSPDQMKLLVLARNEMLLQKIKENIKEVAEEDVMKKDSDIK